MSSEERRCRPVVFNRFLFGVPACWTFWIIFGAVLGHLGVLMASFGIILARIWDMVGSCGASWGSKRALGFPSAEIRSSTLYFGCHFGLQNRLMGLQFWVMSVLRRLKPRWMPKLTKKIKKMSGLGVHFGSFLVVFFVLFFDIVLEAILDSILDRFGVDFWMFFGPSLTTSVMKFIKVNSYKNTVKTNGFWRFFTGWRANMSNGNHNFLYLFWGLL